MQDVWSKRLVLVVVLACFLPASESENVLKHPECKSANNCEFKTSNPSEHSYCYHVRGSRGRGEEQQVMVTYENDNKSIKICCNCRLGDAELAADDPALPRMPRPTTIRTLEFVGCLVPNGSYYEAINPLNIKLSNDCVLRLSELPAEPRLERYHLKGLPLMELTITASTDHPPTRPKKDFLLGLPNLKGLSLREGVEPDVEARMLLPESLEMLSLFHTRLLLPPVNATESQSYYNNWLNRLSSLKSLRLREKSTKLSKTLVTLPPLMHNSLPNLKDLVLTEMLLAPIPENWLRGTNLQNFIIRFCELENLPENFFEGATISNIDFSNNGLRSLPDDVFAPLESSLRELDLSHNKLRGPDLVRAVQSLKSLETLKVNNNPLGSLCGSGQHYGGVESGLPKYLHSLELRRTQATRICDDWIENDFLTSINLDMNNIEYLWYSDLRMRRAKNNPVNLSLKNKKNYTLKIVMNKNDYDKCLHENASQSGGTRKRVQVKLKMNGFACDCNAYWFREMLDKCPLLVQTPTASADVNCVTALGETSLLTHDQDSLTCPYFGSCPDDCSCNKRLSDNAIVVRCAGALTQDTIWPPELIALHVAPGNLKAMPHHIKLVELHTPNNNITIIDEEDIPETLRVLDVRNNSIKHITTAAAQRLLHLSTNVDYSVSLAGNPFACACEDQAAITVLQRAKIMDWNDTKCIDGVYVVEKKSICYDNLLPILLGVMGVLFTVTLAALNLLYLRPRIKQFLFDHGMCLHYVLNVKDDVDDPTKTHDVFISYSYKDRDIAKTIIKSLERRGHTTIEHIRDWMPGENIQTQIVQSVMSARRTLLLLSENYVKSDWSKEEFHVAHAHAMERGSARVIVVLLSDLLSIKNLPHDLRLYLKNNTYLELNNRYFWDKMRRVMPQLQAAPLSANSLLNKKVSSFPYRRQQVINISALSLSQMSIDRDLSYAKKSENDPRESSWQVSPVTQIGKEQFTDNTLTYNILGPDLRSVKEKQIIADPALLLSRLSLDEDPTLSKLVVVTPEQETQKRTRGSSGRASPITPVVTEPPQLGVHKSTLAFNMQREPKAPLMHTAVSPSAC